MLALLVAVSVVAQVEDSSLTPPPPPPAVVDAPVADTPLPPPPPVSRKAKLLPKREPRVSGGVLAGRVGMSILFGALGYSLGAATAIGATLLGVSLGGGYLGIFFGPFFAVLASPLVLALGIFGVALGAAMFGENFGRDFRDALKVAAWLVPASCAAAGIVALAALAVNPLIGLIIGPALFFLAATISAPLIVQAVKPEPEEQVRVDPRMMRGGFAVAF